MQIMGKMEAERIAARGDKEDRTILQRLNAGDAWALGYLVGCGMTWLTPKRGSMGNARALVYGAGKRVGAEIEQARMELHMYNLRDLDQKRSTIVDQMIHHDPPVIFEIPLKD